MEHAPLLECATFATEKDLQAATTRISEQPSIYGGVREGVVVRVADAFHASAFPVSLGKWVRAEHVQTDEHWSHSAVKKQRTG
jgi:hypothetical protein